MIKTNIVQQASGFSICILATGTVMYILLSDEHYAFTYGILALVSLVLLGSLFADYRIVRHYTAERPRPAGPVLRRLSDLALTGLLGIVKTAALLAICFIGYFLSDLLNELIISISGRYGARSYTLIPMSAAMVLPFILMSLGIWLLKKRVTFSEIHYMSLLPVFILLYLPYLVISFFSLSPQSYGGWLN